MMRVLQLRLILSHDLLTDDRCNQIGRCGDFAYLIDKSRSRGLGLFDKVM